MDNQLYINLLIEKKKRALKKSYFEFFCYFWCVLNNEELVLNWHIKYLCEELQYLSEFIIRREKKPYDLIINIPPGSSKSSIITVFFPVWLWIKDPSIVTITSSYSSGLSIDLSLKSRDIVKSDSFQMLFGNEFSLKIDKDNKTNWANNYNGERIITSTGGTITGRHAHLIIIDDAMNAEMAVSEKLRETTYRFCTQTLTTRKKDKENTPTIFVEQRLHESDMTGRMLKKNGKKIKHICLPGILTDDVNPPELKEFYVNGFLDPVRLNQNVLNELKEDLGSCGFASQILQKPAPPEGGYFKKDWFKIISEKELPILTDICMFIDGAYTDNSKNDPTGIDIFGKFGNNIYWIFSTSKHFEMPELLLFINKIGLQFNFTAANRILIEPKASGKTLKQLLSKNTNYSAIELQGKIVAAGKIGRVALASPTCESGKIKIVEAQWNEKTINEICFFPNAEHDEHVDNLCYAANYYFNLLRPEEKTV